MYAGWFAGIGLNHQYTIGDALLDDNTRSGTPFSDAHSLSLVRSKVGTIGATLTAGYGLVEGNYYIGGDISIDVTGNKSHSQYENDLYKDSTIKTTGLVPTISMRFGRFFSSIDCLAYLRVGITFLHNDIDSNAFKLKGFSCQTVSPIVGIGLEKMVFDNYSLKIEGDYRFPADKKKHDLMAYGNDGLPAFNNYKGSIENRTRGYAVRVMCIYHF